MTTLLVLGGIVTFLLLVALAVIGRANRGTQLGPGSQGTPPTTPDQPTLPGLDQ